MQLRERFPGELAGCELVCLDIPDEYGCMDPELVEAFEVALGAWL